MAPSALRALTWAAVAAVFVLMVIGNIVSATGSGLACPDWPLCRGRLIPPLEPGVLIEYSHRLAAALASILLVTTIVMTIRRGGGGAGRRVGLGLLLLLGVQIGLGGLTVLLRLPHLISTAHLVNALLILGGLLVLASLGSPSGLHVANAKVARLARVGLAVLLLQLALGGYVRHTGAGLACPDFPLCSGEILPGHWPAAAHWAHRWLGVTLLGLFIHLAIAGRRTAQRGATHLLADLALLQVALGVAAVLLGLDTAVRAAHAAVGYALWGGLVWISAGAGVWSGALRAARRPSPEIAEAVHAP